MCKNSIRKYNLEFKIPILYRYLFVLFFLKKEKKSINVFDL